jgi:hypothetical protein
MDESSLEPIVTYLRSHSDRYSLEALREQLVQTGYAPDEVERAIGIFVQGEKSPPPRLWPKSLILGVIDAVLLIIVIRLASFSGPSGDGSQWLMDLAFLYGLQILAGLVLSFPRASRLWGFGLVLGFCLFVGAGLLVLTGTCVLAVLH